MMTSQSGTSVVHVTHGEGGELPEQIALVVTRLALQRFRTAVIGPLVRSLRDELSRYNIRWVNVPLSEGSETDVGALPVGQLARLLADNEADIVHAHGYSAARSVALATARMSPRPRLVLSAQGLSLPPPGRLGRRWQERTVRRLLDSFDRVLVESESERETLRRIAPAQADRAVTVAPGFYTNRYSHRVDPGVKRRKLGLLGEAAIVGVPGVLEPGQGFENVLRAAALVVADLPNVEFLVLGGGRLAEALGGLAHELRISGSVVFMDDRADTAEVIAAMNAMVVPSPGSGGLLRALQALSLGIPVVAVEGGTVHEYLGDLAEVLCAPRDDPQAMAGGIRRHLERLPSEHVAPTATSAVGLTLSRDDFLVSREEYDLDREGLTRRSQDATGRRPVDLALERHDISLTAESVAAVYRDLASRG